MRSSLLYGHVWVLDMRMVPNHTQKSSNVLSLVVGRRTLTKVFPDEKLMICHFEVVLTTVIKVQGARRTLF